MDHISGTQCIIQYALSTSSEHPQGAQIHHKSDEDAGRGGGHHHGLEGMDNFGFQTGDAKSFYCQKISPTF